MEKKVVLCDCCEGERKEDDGAYYIAVTKCKQCKSDVCKHHLYTYALSISTYSFEIQISNSENNEGLCLDCIKKYAERLKILNQSFNESKNKKNGKLLLNSFLDDIAKIVYEYSKIAAI